MRVGVITRGKYGQRLIQNIKDHTDFDVVSASVDADLPELIEEPAEFLASMNLNEDAFDVDLIVVYSLHPDLSEEIIRVAGEHGVHAAIIAGGYDKVGVPSELEKMAGQYKMALHISPICCSLSTHQDETINAYARQLGMPVFKVEHDGEKITGVQVLRGSPCGSTWFIVQKLVGTILKEAPAKAGWLAQIYPCRATRGLKGDIHTSAEIHKKAMEEAIDEAANQGAT